MKFLRFIFSFLYTRNGHTGQYELSRLRVWMFGCAAGFVLLLLVTALLLQTPVEYQRMSL